MGAALCRGAWVSHCRGPSCFGGAQALGSQAPGAAARGLSGQLTGLVAPWRADRPGPGIEFSSPVLAGRVLTPGSPGVPESPLGVPEPLNGGDLAQQDQETRAPLFTHSFNIPGLFGSSFEPVLVPLQAARPANALNLVQ